MSISKGLIHTFGVATVLWSTTLLGVESDSKFIGSYISPKTSESEICEGYSVALWNKQGIVFGYIYVREDHCQDPPLGILEDVQYSPSTGHISFKAKVLGNTYSCDKGNCTYSKDIVSFKGTLLQSTLSGTMSWYNINAQKEQLVESVTLNQTKISPDMEVSAVDNYSAAIKHWSIIKPLWDSIK